jgi:signal transduction histidine kinase
MKLVQKLTFAMILGISAVLAFNGYLRARREVDLYRADRVRDHRIVGTALGVAFAGVWRSHGKAQALAMLEEASARDDDFDVRWVDAPAWVGRGPETTLARDGRGRSMRLTVVPVSVAPGQVGEIELLESPAGEQARVRNIIVDRALTTTLLATIMSLLAAALGTLFVGRPMRSLIDKARRVGRGDFSGPLQFRQRDELGELAREMNAMCEQLVEANALRVAETAARLEALEQLRRADRLTTVGTLASGVAHELGTPLNVVGARAGMIADGETTPDETMESARVIADACQRMSRIIRQLLDFARPRGPERAATDVRDIARRAMALLGPMAAKKGVVLTLREEGTPAVAEIDAGQIEQVLTNVLVNAIHATSGRGSVEVRVSTERATPPPDLGGPEAEYVCARVRDDGSGIAPEHLPHVFEPFFTTKEVGDGTGLGLSVAHGIVHEHRGFLTVESAPGRGTTFTIHLPRGRAT